MILRTGRIKRGFTLIEIMLALVVLSFGLVVVLRSFGTALWGLKKTEDIKAASYLLSEKMEEIKEISREHGGIMKGEASGRFEEEGYESYAWNIKAVPAEIDQALNEVTLDISWQDRNVKRSISAVTYLADKIE